MIHELLEALHKSQSREEKLEHRIHLLLQRLYGPRSEKIDPHQLLLFADALQAAPAEEAAPEEEAGEAGATPAPRRGHGRQKLPDDLPRIPLVHDLTAAEKLCPECGHERPKIGVETREQLEYTPASVFIIEHQRCKYACQHCQGHVSTAPPPPQSIDKGLPGPGLLAYVTTSKYLDHLPLYRLERILERHGVTLSRSTLCDWMARAAHLLRPLYECMVERVLASRVVHTDDTPVPVQDATKPGRMRQGRLWVYLGDADHPDTVFAYTPNRQRDGPANFLKNYRGFLQADAFGGYDGIYASGLVTEVGCHAHARRKFFEAKESDPTRALQALAYYRQLYDIESSLKGADAEEKVRVRQARAVPILQDFRAWIDAQCQAVLPKSPMGQAFTYALNQWEALVRYTTQGFLAIDNNVAEREMKRLAIGRKNWLFVGSDQGGATAAILFSLTATCQRHGLDAQAYLRDVFYRLPTQRRDQIEELLPEHWQAPAPAGTAIASPAQAASPTSSTAAPASTPTPAAD